MALDPARVVKAISFNQRRASDLLPELNRHFQHPPGERFTEPLVQAIAALQEELELDVDGMIGKDSRAVLEELLSLPTDGLWPALGSSLEAQRAHYVALCQRLWHDVSSERATLLGLRGVKPLALRTHFTRSRRGYDDTFVLLAPGEDVRIFAGATHPFQTDSTASPDFDGDRRGDVGMIRPGLYTCTATKHHRTQHPALRVTRPDGDGRIPAYRDVDHDGVFSPQEMRSSIEATSGAQVLAGIGAFATDILFHPGDTKYSSIGCQTADSADIVKLHSVAPLDYLLVTAEAAIPGPHGHGTG